MASTEMDEATAALIASMVADDEDHFDYGPPTHHHTSSLPDQDNDEEWIQETRLSSTDSPQSEHEITSLGAPPSSHPTEAETTQVASWDVPTAHTTPPNTINNMVDPGDHATPSTAAKGKGRAAVIAPTENNSATNDDDDEDGQSISPSPSSSEDNTDTDNENDETHPPRPLKKHKPSTEAAAWAAAEDSLDDNNNPFFPSDDAEYHHDPQTGRSIPHLTIPWSFTAKTLGIVPPSSSSSRGRQGWKRGRGRAYEEDEGDGLEVVEIRLDDEGEGGSGEEGEEVEGKGDRGEGMAKGPREWHRRRVEEMRGRARVLRGW